MLFLSLSALYVGGSNQSGEISQILVTFFLQVTPILDFSKWEGVYNFFHRFSGNPTWGRSLATSWGIETQTLPGFVTAISLLWERFLWSKYVPYNNAIVCLYVWYYSANVSAFMSARLACRSATRAGNCTASNTASSPTGCPSAATRRPPCRTTPVPRSSVRPDLDRESHAPSSSISNQPLSVPTFLFCSNCADSG